MVVATSNKQQLQSARW